MSFAPYIVVNSPFPETPSFSLEKSKNTSPPPPSKPIAENTHTKIINTILYDDHLCVFYFIIIIIICEGISIAVITPVGNEDMNASCCNLNPGIDGRGKRKARIAKNRHF